MIKGTGMFAMMKSGANDFIHAWDLVLIGVLLVALTGFVWLKLMQITILVKCIVWGGIFVIILMLMAMSWFSGDLYKKQLDKDPNCFEFSKTANAWTWPSEKPCANSTLQF